MSDARSAPTCVRLAAPAKLNLGLRIVGRRADGYHLLESLFVPLDLADDLDIAIDADPVVAAGHEVELEVHLEDGADGADVPNDERNLAVRAARAFLERAGLDAHVRIELTKRIPTAAGLGGGSSDAGAVLRALYEALPARLTPGALGDVALALGADVPFFLDPKPALVAGIGERRGPPGELPGLAFVLANPRTSVATATVFARRAQSAAPFSPEGALARDLEAARRTDFAEPSTLAALLANDLAPAAEALCPDIGRLARALAAAGALATGQSGSGATVFGVFRDEPAAQSACNTLSANDSAWFRVAISPAAR